MTNSPDAAPEATSRSIHIMLWILQILLAAIFCIAGGSKLTGSAPMIKMFDIIGIGDWFRYLTGTLELIGAAGLLIPKLTRWAALLLACVMTGAVIAHLTVLNSPPTGPIILFALTALVFWRRGGFRS